MENIVIKYHYWYHSREFFVELFKSDYPLAMGFTGWKPPLVSRKKVFLMPRVWHL